VQHPVTGIVCDKFDVARLRYTHEYRVPWAHVDSGCRPPSRASDHKLMAVKVEWVVIHSEVDQTNAHALTVPHN